MTLVPLGRSAPIAQAGPTLWRHLHFLYALIAPRRIRPGKATYMGGSQLEKKQRGRYRAAAGYAVTNGLSRLSHISSSPT